MYKLTKTTIITRVRDNASIPADPDNRDYAEYLEWLAAGNTPLPVPTSPAPNPRIGEIKARLGQIDAESIRALRATAVSKSTPADATKLSALDTEADNLRAELGRTAAFV